MKEVNGMNNATLTLLKNDLSSVRKNPFPLNQKISEVVGFPAGETGHRVENLLVMSAVSQKENVSDENHVNNKKTNLHEQLEPFLALMVSPPLLPVGMKNSAVANPGNTFLHQGVATSLAKADVPHSVSNDAGSAEGQTLLLQALLEQANRAAPTLAPSQQAREAIINAQQPVVSLIGNQQHDSQINKQGKPLLIARNKGNEHKIVEPTQHFDRKDALELSRKEPVELPHNTGRLSLPFTSHTDVRSQDWSHQLYSVLKERIQFQLDNVQQEATLRLDPPTLGKIDIAIQLDAGKLVVHINAAHGDVYRSLQQISDTIRQHLTEQNFVQVDVHVSTGSQQQQQHQRHAQQEENVNYALEIAADDNVFTHDDNIITKV